MNSFLTNVLAGAVGAVVSAMTVGAMGQLAPLGSRLVIPADAVIAVAGECPPGWHRYDAANGRYVVGADGRDLEAGMMGQASGATFEYRDGDLRGKGDVIVSAPHAQPPNLGGPRAGTLLVGPGGPSSYIALSLCQRRW